MHSKLCLLVWVALTMALPLAEMHAAPGAIVLIDRTGSMSAIRPVTGNSRCADARTTASVDINDFFANHPGGSLAVWTFAGATNIDVTAGFVGQAAALAAVAALTPEGRGGMTPLADALCDAGDALTVAFPADDRILYVSSDGGENNSSGACAGPHAAYRP